MKKLCLFLIAILTLMLVFTGCGGSNPNQPGNVKVNVGDAGKVSVNNDGKIKMETSLGNSEISVDTGKGVSLPEGYSEKILPVYKDSKIIATNKTKSDGKDIYSISCVSNTDAKQVYEYYKDTLKNMQSAFDSSSEGSYMLSGLIDNNSVMVIISSDAGVYGYKTLLNLTLQIGQ
ncbi:MAG: hypothetical protein Q8920_14480 [Bacillota bacterium]|nr:hypothetical protein [Bacillota bacterium]